MTIKPAKTLESLNRFISCHAIMIGGRHCLRADMAAKILGMSRDEYLDCQEIGWFTKVHLQDKSLLKLHPRRDELWHPSLEVRSAFTYRQNNNNKRLTG